MNIKALVCPAAARHRIGPASFIVEIDAVIWSSASNVEGHNTTADNLIDGHFLDQDLIGTIASHRRGHLLDRVGKRVHVARGDIQEAFEIACHRRSGLVFC